MDTNQRQWHIRPVRKQDAPAIVDLLNAVFGNWGNQTTWLWKYKNIPTTFQLNSSVAEIDGRIVGHYGIIPLDIIHRGKLIRGAQAVDAAVLPEYRRQGMMSRLARYVLDAASDAQVVFIYAFPGLFSLNLNKQIGFQPVMFIPEMVRVLDFKGFFTERLRSFPRDVQSFWEWRLKGNWSPDHLERLTNFRSTLLWMLSWLSAPVRHRRIMIRDFEVRELTSFEASVNKFYQAGPVLSLVKRSDYLTWRYLQHPDQKYLSWGAYQSGNLVGYLVMKMDELKCSICELAYLPDYETVVFQLVDKASNYARDAGSNLLDIWFPKDNSLWSSLQKLGFISPHRLHRFAKNRERLSTQLYQVILYTHKLPARTKNQLLEDLSFWSLSMGDSDLI